MKPEKPITRKEMYLDVATGGSTELPSPVTREEKYLAKIAGESVDIPTPVTRYEMLLAAVAGESYTLTPVTRLEIYLAKAAGQDVEIPQPVTREEMYWFDYCGGTPTPPEREYTGAVPVTFVADGTPLIDYIISGNTVQSGTPTPDNPIMPQGTGDMSSNLYNVSDKSATTNNLVTLVDLGADTTVNTITVSCMFDNLLATGTYGAFLDFLKDDNTHQYVTLSNMHNVADDTPIIANTITTGNYYATKNNITFRYIKAYLYSTAYNKFQSGTIKWAFYDSEKKDYEPYGYKIPILSGGTTTPVYLGEVHTTRKIKKLVLTGEESWNTYQSTYYITVNDYYRMYDIGSHLSVCSHYPIVQLITLPEMHYGLGGLIDGNTHSAWNGNIVFNPSPMILSITDWKSYLTAQYTNGTPVTVWYVLATEETAVVNEPLMRIGNYTDTLSMEQAGVQIPTANGSTTLDVDTTVKPSEVYIKYRGEAVATLSALPAEVSSPEAVPEEENPEETEETENGSEDVSL